MQDTLSDAVADQRIGPRVGDVDIARLISERTSRMLLPLLVSTSRIHVCNAMHWHAARNGIITKSHTSSRRRRKTYDCWQAAVKIADV